MCLYEQKIKNIKYLPNKKNNGIPPKLTDRRLEYITTNCGWCKECRTKIANDWRIRLCEEIKHDKNGQFITFTFSPESINKLETDMYLKKWRGIENENGEMFTDVNMLAAYAVRMWCERWRKRYKKSPKHWLITELGHTNSERIHLHGIVWGEPEKIEKTWQYGQIFCGQWVDERTINYIMKYVTKLDKDHKGYKQRIITSKGIGKNYVYERKDYHKYNGEKTIKNYKASNGRELALPRYYKEKFWSEIEREELFKIEMDKGEIFIGGEKINKNTADKEVCDKKLENVRLKNGLAGFGSNETVNKTYIVTDLMRKHCDEVKDYRNEKLVTCVERREVDEIKDSGKGYEISKANYVKKLYYGKYTNTTTEAQRNYNELLEEAKEKRISVRELRLKKAGIIN